MRTTRGPDKHTGCSHNPRRSPNWIPQYTTLGASAQEKFMEVIMSEIEKMRRYIERTKMKKADRFYLDMAEAFELARQARDSSGVTLEVIALAFNYGKAKGYRAAKAEGRAQA